VPTCCHLPWPQALEAERKRGAAAAEEAGAASEAARAAHRQAAAAAERRLQVARPPAVPAVLPAEPSHRPQRAW